MADHKLLTLLLEQAEHARDLALVAFQQAEQRLRQARAQRQDLDDYQMQYDARWMAQFQQGAAAVAVVQAHQQFGARLQDAIGQQTQQAGLLEARLGVARARLQDCEVKVASVRKLIERRAIDALSRQHRAEQKASDEFGTRSHYTAQVKTCATSSHLNEGTP